MAARIIADQTAMALYQWSDVVTTAVVADGCCRTIADSGLDCGRAAVDATAAGISMIAATTDNRRPSSAAVADQRLAPLITVAGDDW